MLKRSFFQTDTVTLAKRLLGTELIRVQNGKLLSGIIIETEAYLNNDPASHSFRGPTKRNQAMFGEAGTAYVYFTYGTHYCFNVVSSASNIGEAVLVRALIPQRGIRQMKINRNIENIFNLTNGPGKICQALQIDNTFNFHHLNHRPLYLLPKITVPKALFKFQLELAFPKQMIFF